MLKILTIPCRALVYFNDYASTLSCISFLCFNKLAISFIPHGIQCFLNIPFADLSDTATDTTAYNQNVYHPCQNHKSNLCGPLPAMVHKLAVLNLFIVGYHIFLMFFFQKQQPEPRSVSLLLKSSQK